jgi:hypothetical protein
MMKIKMLMLKLSITILAFALIGAAAGQPIGGGAHVGNLRVRCSESVEDLKEALHGCVLQVINPIHPIQCFIQDCCRVISHDILCACQARMELQPLLAGVTPLFEKCRVYCDRL